MKSHRPLILLTGFGAFPGVPVNATSVLAPRLADAARARFPGHRVRAHLLPTEWRAAPAMLEDLLADEQPVLALHFGVSSRATGFAIEARARNACAMTPDACGEPPPFDRVAPGGPAMLPASIPVQRIVQRLRRQGIPASVSRDAGAYLCNAILYHALSRGPDRPGPRPRQVGFVHVPTDLLDASPGAYPRAGSGAALDCSSAIEGGLEIIATSLGRPSLGPAPSTSRPAVRRPAA